MNPITGLPDPNYDANGNPIGAYSSMTPYATGASSMTPYALPTAATPAVFNASIASDPPSLMGSISQLLNTSAATIAVNNLTQTPGSLAAQTVPQQIAAQAHNQQTLMVMAGIVAVVFVLHSKGGV
jgi:hypothetical protein